MDYNQNFSNSPQASFGGGPFSAASPQQQNAGQYSQYPHGQAGSFTNMPGTVLPGGVQSQMQNNQLHQARAAALQQHQQQQQMQRQQQQQQQQQQHHHQHQHQQQQQHQQQLHQQQSSQSPYSNAQFAPSLVSPAHQQFVQNRQTASPASASNSVPAYATPSAQQSPSLSSHSQLPMNPPTSQPSSVQSMAIQTPVKAVPQSPMSPVTQAREKQRIDVLLEINQLLLKEVMDLHAQGKAGHVGPPSAAKPEGEKQQPSPEYAGYMRRLQANLAFLAQNAEKHNKPNQNILPGPAIMTSPASPDELVKQYAKLQALFPGWKGVQAKPAMAPQRMNSMSSQSSAQYGMQNGMQNGMASGLQNNMQHGMQTAMPNSMQSNMQSNMQNGMQSGMPNGMHNMHNSMQNSMHPPNSAGFNANLHMGQQAGALQMQPNSMS